jgi:hypothetical protein
MYQLIVRYVDIESWNVTQYPNYEMAVSARETFLKAQRKSELYDASLRRAGRTAPNQRTVAWTAPNRKRVAWTAIVSVKSPSRADRWQS